MSVKYRTPFALNLISGFLLFLTSSLPVSAQQQKNIAKEYDVDSTVYAYYLRCKAETASPVVMNMADTLFRMAGEKGDERMQAVALSFKVDHFYFQSTEKDSILHYVNVVKAFARKTNQPKYYYFIWGQRLINHYIKHHQYNTALYEADKMMKAAEMDDYPVGMANAYNVMCSIYQIKTLCKLACEHKEKEIEIIRKYNIDTYGLSSAYSTLSLLYCNVNRMDKAKEALDKAKECIVSERHEHYYNTIAAVYYRMMHDYDKVWAHLQRSKELQDTCKGLQIDTREYDVALRDYYLDTGQPDKALEVQRRIERIYIQKNEFYRDDVRILADIYWKTGDLSKASRYYQEYLVTRDSLYAIEEDIAAGEFAAMLGMERLSAEKSELQHTMQQRDSVYKKRIIYFLTALLLLGVILIYRERLLNNRLRASQRRLTEMNKELLASKVELVHAKELAENASIMKSEFIQNMSHEIRTPLNSIVGFSQIVSAMSKDNEEAGEYACIIEQSSNNLLQLIEDVLDISNLDSGSEISTDTLTDASLLCMESLARIELSVAPGIMLKQEYELEEYRFLTNPQRVSQILFHLLKNATKFTRQGQITLGWHKDDAAQCIIFSVTDTGIGIPEDKRESVFERFTKLDTFVQGTGLGLSIGRICAEKMGGSLTIDPEYTGGCRFLLMLPLRL